MAISGLAMRSTSRQAGDSLASRVGDTPLLELRKVTRGLRRPIRILAKAEWHNPSGSVKDRAALNMMLTAREAGQFKGGRRLLDSTSGNMGISYATIGAALNIPITVFVPETASVERLKMLRLLGAEIICTDGAEGTDGAIRAARSLAQERPDRYWYANQYDNAANWQAHYKSTGPELVQQTGGAITHLVAGIGTSGTLMGAGRYLRGTVPGIRVVGVEPDGPLHGLEGLKHMASAIRPAIYDATFPDRILAIPTELAYATVRRLAREEGLFVGISSGAAVAAALDLAAELESATIVAILPDSGFKYLSDDAVWEVGW